MVWCGRYGLVYFVLLNIDSADNIAVCLLQCLLSSIDFLARGEINIAEESGLSIIFMYFYTEGSIDWR